MAYKPLTWTTVCLATATLICGATSSEYRGKPLGKLSQLHHAVSGEVYAVDARTLHIRNFNYDGEGPAAYFYVGTSKTPSGSGFRIRDERGTTNVLPRYKNQDITLSLPEGKTLQNIRWFSVWCDEFAVNFGDVKIPKGFEFPRPHKLGALSGIHGVSSDQVVIVDAQTLLIPNFSYDGEAPDAKFWVGEGSRPTPQGIRIPDENGKTAPLRRYDRKTIVLTLPGEMTVFDIGHFGVWCEAFTVDFGHVLLPQGINVPPSLKMLGVSPQSKLNCEVLWDDLAYEVRWAVAGDSIVLQLVARLESGEYMAFGISGDDTKSKMVGGDVTVAWVDKETLKGQAKDYFLDAKSQCSGARGSCPDENIVENTNNVRLLNAALVNGYSIVTYQRSLKAQDELDRPIYTNGTQPIIWAIGPLNARQEVSYHSIANRENILLDFGRPPRWNCPTPEAQNVPSQQQIEVSKPARQKVQATTETSLDTRQQSSNRRESAKPRPQTATPASVPKTKPWDIPAIQCNEPEDGVFYAQMGPTGGKRGYPAITGHVGWGISWYINGLLIPEVNVVRGRTYTFIVEGGLDPNTPARYHPFYITDDSVGGYEYKTPEERAQVQIFAGAVQNKKGEVRPTGIGRLCNWTPDQNQPQADEFASFGAYQRTLRLECDQGEPGIVQWTVAKDTPDTVYYQCYTHRYLGWKINVLDDCDEAAGSESEPVFVRAPQTESDEEPDAEASIRHETKVRPDVNPNQIEAGPVASKLIGNPPENTPTAIQYVPEFHFFNQETGEPLDQATVHRMNLEQEIKQLESQFYNNQPPVQAPLQTQISTNQYQSVVPNFHNDDQFLTFFHTPKPMYSVQENSEEEQSALPTHQFQLTPQTERPAYVPTTKPHPMHYETTTVFDDSFNQEFIRNYQQLQAEAASKMKKHNMKMQQHYGKPPRLQYSAPRRPTNPHHALTLQQRPVPPGMFRPPFLPPPNKKNYPKRPIAAASQKVPAYASINSIPNRPSNYIRPHKPQRKPEPNRPIQQHQQTNQQHYPMPPKALLQTQTIPHVQQVLALEKLISTMRPQEPKPTMFPSTPLFVERHPVTTETTQLAQNTGFNPSSVKVEGGFKPILNTGIAPSFKVAEERMDDMVDEDNVDDDIGVIDLTKQETKQDIKLIQEAEEKDLETSANKTENKEDIFKHLKPVMFEPMFIPSPPDHRYQKLATKHKKKPTSYKYHGDIKIRNNHLEPYNAQKNKHIKMRPRPTLIRRPLYPNNVMPPFKIPVRGGSPQFRYQIDDESLENTTDFEIIQMNNDTINISDEKAENIFEVMEMQSENNSTDSANSELVVDEDDIYDSDFKVKNTTDDEIAMADDRKDFYLSPDSQSGPVTYDGKIVSAIAAPTIPETRRRFDISKRPQFAPFQGELPLSFDQSSLGDLPQLQESTAARSDILPPLNRRRRSPDHVPGHVGEDHDHYDHEHDHHNHSLSHPETKNVSVTNKAGAWLLAPVFIIALFL